MVKQRATGIRGHIERKKEKNAYRNEIGEAEERRTLDNIVMLLKQI
jgi:hypothetical protein